MASLAGRNAVFSIACQIWSHAGVVGGAAVRVRSAATVGVVAMSQGSQLRVDTTQPNAANAMHNGNAFMDNMQQAHPARGRGAWTS